MWPRRCPVYRWRELVAGAGMEQENLSPNSIEPRHDVAAGRERENQQGAERDIQRMWAERQPGYTFCRSVKQRERTRRPGYRSGDGRRL